MKSGRTLSFCISAIATGLLGFGCAFAQTKPKASVPLPPPRPQSLTPADPTTLPVESRVAAPVVQPAVEPDDPEPSRERLRACSLEWRGMKKSGAAVGLIWRDFSKACMGRE